MPLYDWKCRNCHAVHEQITVPEITIVPCRSCVGASHRMLSAPGGLRCHGAQGGMVLSETQKKLIKEPVWEDATTGRITAAH